MRPNIAGIFRIPAPQNRFFFFFFLGFKGHTELYDPHPFTLKTPTSPEGVQTQKMDFDFVFFVCSSCCRGQNINSKCFCSKFFDNPSGHGCPRRKPWTSAQKSAFSCGPGGGKKLFDPSPSGRKGQGCPREIRTNKFMFMNFIFPSLLLVLRKRRSGNRKHATCQQQTGALLGSCHP